MHFESIHCNYNPTNHYHVLIHVSVFSADFLNKQNPCSFPCFFTTFRFLFAFTDTLRQREMFFKNYCWQWSTKKAISTNTQKRTLLLPYSSVCPLLRKMSQTNFNNQNAYNETLLDTNFWRKCIEAEKSSKLSHNNWKSGKSSVDSLWTACWCFL